MGQTYSQEEHVYLFLSHNLLKALIATLLLGNPYTSDGFHDLLTHAAHLLLSDYEEDLPYIREAADVGEVYVAD